MDIRFDVSIDIDEFEREASRAIALEIGSMLQRVEGRVLTPIQAIIREALIKSPEYASLLSSEYGELRTVFGIKDSQKALDNIVAAVCASVKVTPRPPSQGDLGGLSVDILRSDLQEVLSVEGASYVSTNKAGVSTPVPWLSWLLLEGVRIIIADWIVVTPNTPEATRTRGGVMVKPKSPKGFIVPPEYAGTIDSNWLTRVLRDVESSVNDILEKGFRSV